MKNKNPKLSALRIGIITSLVLAVIHLILIGAAYQRQTAAAQLDQDRLTLEENLQALEAVNQDQIDELEAELEEIKTEIIELEAGFPELGAPFALFNQAEILTEKSQVDLRSVTRIRKEFEDAVAGSYHGIEYSLEVEGSLQDCINFIEQLETVGLDSIHIQYASLWPEDQLCVFEVRTLGIFQPE